MLHRSRFHAVSRTRLACVLALALLPLAAGCRPPGDAEASRTGAALFSSPATNPVALGHDGRTLYVANTTAGTLSVLDVARPWRPRLLAEIPVGLDPVGVAVRPRRDPRNFFEDEIVLVTNYISDSISVVSRRHLDVVQTVQDVDPATGVTRTDEPTGVVFAGPDLAFVTLDQTNQVLALHLDAAGQVTIDPTRLGIAAQAPRALAASEGRLYVAAFESGNQTELPTCAPGDTRGLDQSDSWDEGCEFTLELIEGIGGGGGNLIDLGTLFDFAASNPNIGGRVIRDRDLPDRDLFVFDLTAAGFDSDPGTPGVQPLQVVETVGTLLYGLAVGPDERVYVAGTEARNHLDGLFALEGRMFENRMSVLDCAGGCGAPAHVDLDASAGAGATVPTPYGVAVSRDGETVVVTGAGSDGLPPGAAGGPPGQPELYGLAILDRDGQVVSGLRTGAIPQGVALASSRWSGRAHTAYVWNAVDGTLSVVDVRDPASPRIVRDGIALGADPTPPDVKAGRVHFMSARASTTGTFSCESCHPNGNIDQILWVINAPEGPDDGPEFVGEIPEPRTTMPIRGLRDTLPLHWEGNLADPFEGTGGSGHEGPSPGCVPGAENEVACIRHLVNASLAGVMCDPFGCPTGPAGLPGAHGDEERDQMAAFLAAVPYPPMPKRRPDDRLSDTARLGAQDFFTNEDGQGINDGVGQVVNFAPTTCADNPIGCHSLPLTVSTNSSVVGGFDAPSVRGMVDRHVLFSNGVVSSQEALAFAQACADGVEPPVKTFNIAGFELELEGDPCNLNSEVIELLIGAPLAELPFPSGEQIWDPSVGMTERGSFLATFEYIFSLVYGVRGDRIWAFQEEVSVGLPGLTGRQLPLSEDTASAPETLASLALFEEAAEAGKIAAVARSRTLGHWRYEPAAGSWLRIRRGALHPGDGLLGRDLRDAIALARRETLDTDELVDLASLSRRGLTVTAHLPEGITIGGADRQPLLDVDPDLRAAEESGDAPSLPRPQASAAASFRLGAWYVEPGARVLVNGAVCDGCSFSPATAATGDPAIDLSIPAGSFDPGPNALQVLNPGGWASNELPLVVDP
jgi:YVTN family beta-propeller protein